MFGRGRIRLIVGGAVCLLVTVVVAIFAAIQQLRADVTSSFGLYEWHRKEHWLSELSSTDTDRRIEAIRAVAWLRVPEAIPQLLASPPTGIRIDELGYRASALARVTNPASEREMLVMRVAIEEFDSLVGKLALICLGEAALPTVRVMQQGTFRGYAQSGRTQQFLDHIASADPSVKRDRRICDTWRREPIFRTAE